MMITESVYCNLCGGNETTTIFEHVPRIDTPGTQVVQCNQCGLVYLNPRLKHLADNFTMSEAYLRQFYLPMYQQMGLVSADGKLVVEKNYDFHAWYLRQIKPYRLTNRMLDVGCAIGLFLAAAQVDGWEIDGIDPAPPLATYAREQIGVRVSQAELQALAFPKAHFDVVTLWNVTEHLLDPTAVLREIHRILRPGGLLVIQVPNWNDIARQVLGAQWDMFVTDHFTYYTVQTLGKLLDKTGFTLKQFDAARLVESEIAEITTKVSAQAAQEAIAHLQHSQATDRGSTLTVYAERSTTTLDRIEKAIQLAKTGKLKALTQETRNYVKWQLRRFQAPN